MSDGRYMFDMVPARFRDELRAYIENGVRPGQFLVGVLDNDLRTAYECSDPQHLRGHSDLWREMGALLVWLKEMAPVESYGAPGKVELWIAKGGLSKVPEQSRLWTGFPVETRKTATVLRLETMARVAAGEPLDIDLRDLESEEANRKAFAFYLDISSTRPAP